jgi:hypothetical protein
MEPTVSAGSIPFPWDRRHHLHKRCFINLKRFR